jgi:hypothetical protein
MDYTEAFNIGTIQLEPRLQEYVRRKKFNRENDITPNIPEEQEFGITKADIRLIKKHKRGDNNIYTQKTLSTPKHFVKPRNTIDTTDKAYKNDPRYKRLQNKMKMNKQAREQINNLEGIDENYTMFHQSNPYDMREDNRPSIVSKPYNRANDTIMINSREYIQNTDNVNSYNYNVNRKSNNQSAYHHTPNIAYKQRLQPQDVSGGLKHSRDINDVIGNIDNYNKHLNNSYEYINGGADLDTHTMTPNTRTGTQRGSYNSYQSVPFRYGNGLADVSVEDSLRGGYRDSSKKSVGFRNPFEHQFDFISGDISSANHSVQMWPTMTRGQNKEIARPYSMAVKSDRRYKRTTN